ncbi:MAG TPA: glycosyltransferase family 2 protein [Alphaproteobacteria bacterium]|nr:glycosyltransferase family 2 protein [Alphaproteobacteria bacterium]
MEKKLPISVFIIAKDEEERLPKAIESVKDWVDEIIVIDSGSNDRTVEIANNLGAIVIFNKWEGFGQQKIFGEQRCKNDWILNIDADEEISTELKQEIIIMFSQNRQNEFAAYKLRWEMVFFTQKNPPLFAVGSNFIRLYNKQKAGFNNSTVHDSVILKDNQKTGKLKNIVYHRCFRSMKHWADKINYYTSLQAEDFVNKNRKLSCLRIIFEPLFAFFKSYILRRYFFYGINGFNASLMYAYSKTLRLAKIKELYDLRNCKKDE